MPRQIIYLVYRVLLTAAFPFLVLYVFLRGLRNPRYFRRLSERFGFLPHSFHRTVSAAIWLHAVSVGEILSCIALIRRLRLDLPGAPVFVSCSTLAGMQAAEEKLAGLADGVFYAPFDYCFAVRRILRTIRPLLVIVLETEIWPNLYNETKRAGSGLLVVNGRISERAYPKYRRFGWFFRTVLGLPDRILVQSERDRERFLALGAPANRISAAGNLKYDFDPKSAVIPGPVREFLDRRQASQIWIAASTMPPALPSDPDEDDAVLAAFRQLDNGSRLLILAPRKPERFDVVAQKLAAAQIPFVRRSDLPCRETANVLLLDSIGELGSLFSLAGAVFVGGTLASRGGHNILEPAFFGKPIVIGRHMENFADIAQAFTAADAIRRIDRAEDLGPAIEALFADTTMGERGRLLAEAQRGATARAVEQAAQLYDCAVPHVIPLGPLQPFLWILAGLWQIGGRRKRMRQTRERQRLDAPVISIGNLGMGGSGKTPFVALLCRLLSDAGHSPAILTRGYRRSSPERHTLLAPGEAAPVARTGDEAQILLRACHAAIGIGADRAATGKLMEARFHPSVFLLDDGFQHARLQRDLDIVLIDALDPFAGGELFPVGRLREPLTELSRADAFVITRSEPERVYRGVQAKLRRYNANAQIYRAVVAPLYWSGIPGADRLAPFELQNQPCAAFCALANPGSFWRTLSRLGYTPAFQWAFGDHHPYRPEELRQLGMRAQSSGAKALLCTEKDAVNLPANAAELVFPARLYWLKIQMELEGGSDLLARIDSLIPRAGRLP